MKRRKNEMDIRDIDKGFVKMIIDGDEKYNNE